MLKLKLKKRGFTLCLACVLPVLLVLSACQPIQVPTQPAASGMIPWSQLSTEMKIANAMSGGPMAIARAATILDWPTAEGDDWHVLREGTNRWTCFTDDADFLYPTPAVDPMCLDDVWVEWNDALINGREPVLNAPGIAYMYQGGATVNNDDPFASGPPEGMTVQSGVPHIMLIVPGGLEPNDFASEMHKGMPFIMFGETVYEHVMVPIVAHTLTAPDPSDRIANAMSAGPMEIAQDATILEWPTEPDASWTVLREGTNGWTCLPDDNVMTPSTLTNDPMCLDAVWLEWLTASLEGREPQITRPGIGYMFQGGSIGDNEDPMMMTPPEGQEWQIDPPHVMVIYPEPLDVDAWSHDAQSGEPYIMFGGTPFEHLMIPVDPVLFNGTAEAAMAPMAATQSAVAADPAAEQANFVEAALALEEAYQAEDLETVVNFYAENAISYAPGFPSDVGQEAIRGVYQDYFETYELTRDFQLVDVTINGDFATRTAEWTQILNPRDGSETITEVGRCVLGWQKVEGEWKVIWEIWNTYDDLPSQP